MRVESGLSEPATASPPVVLARSWEQKIWSFLSCVELLGLAQ